MRKDADYGEQARATVAAENDGSLSGSKDASALEKATGDGGRRNDEQLA